MSDCIFLHDVESIEVGEWETETATRVGPYQTCTIKVKRISCTDPTHCFDTDIHLFRKNAQAEPAPTKTWNENGAKSSQTFKIKVTNENGKSHVISFDFENKAEAESFCNIETAAGMGETYEVQE